jgi:putative membrane protein
MRGDKWIKRGGEESALEILKKRYARGEITKEEYDKMKKEIE